MPAESLPILLLQSRGSEVSRIEDDVRAILSEVLAAAAEVNA